MTTTVKITANCPDGCEVILHVYRVGEGTVKETKLKNGESAEGVVAGHQLVTVREERLPVVEKKADTADAKPNADSGQAEIIKPSDVGSVEAALSNPV